LAYGDALAVWDQSGQPPLHGVLEREFLLGDELQDDGGDERLGDTADAEAVARAHPGLGFQVAVAAREADCPVPLADEEHSARHTGGDDLIQVALEVPLAGGQTVARGARGRGGGGGGEREQREWEPDVLWVLVMSLFLSWWVVVWRRARPS